MYRWKERLVRLYHRVLRWFHECGPTAITVAVLVLLAQIPVRAAQLQDEYDRGYAAGQEAAGEPRVEQVIRVQEHDYIANFNSEIFHRSTCGTLPNEDKCVYFDVRDVAVALGYRPCKNCNP